MRLSTIRLWKAPILSISTKCWIHPKQAKVLVVLTIPTSISIHSIITVSYTHLLYSTSQDFDYLYEGAVVIINNLYKARVVDDKGLTVILHSENNIAGSDQNIQILESARRNVLDASAGTVVALTNPLSYSIVDKTSGEIRYPLNSGAYTTSVNSFKAIQLPQN